MSDDLRNRVALLPYPFCGEQLVPTQSGDGYTHNRRVRSANNCVLSWVVIRPPHQDAWNTRAAAALAEMGGVGEEYCVKCGAPRSNHPYRHPFEAPDEVGR